MYVCMLHTCMKFFLTLYVCMYVCMYVVKLDAIEATKMKKKDCKFMCDGEFIYNFLW